MSQIKFFSYLQSKKISPTQYSMLYQIAEEVTIGRPYNVDLNALYDNGFLTRKDGQWKATVKTKNIIKYVESLFINDNNKKAHDEKSLDKLVNKLREIYPHKIPSGKRVIRSNAKEVKDRLGKFFRAYDYDYTVVVEALTRYVDEQVNSENNGEYLKRLNYFIMKGTESLLADYCQEVIDNPIINKNAILDHRFKEL